jgi:hypothetical protein
VSLTSVLCKILERIVHNNIFNHLSKFELISKHQHGFVKRKSCTTNLLESLDIITSAAYDGKVVDLLFMDFEKAFDKVPHNRLIKKLSAYGIEGKLLAWIKHFIIGRSQRVIMGENISNWCEVFSGVPQGSVLGPLLFIIYINDLPNMLTSECKLYADDSKLISITDKNDSVKKSPNQLQIDINKVIEWCNIWEMKINKEKCKVMHFGIKNMSNKYTINDANGDYEIQETKLERDLGILISNDLKWHEQIKSSAAKAQRTLGLIKRTFSYLNSDIVKSLYCALVRPHLEFAVPVWNPTLKKDVFELEKVQKRATKLIPDIRNLSYEYRLQKLNLTTLENRRSREDLIYQFKISTGLQIVNWYKNPTLAPSITNDGPSSNVRGHSKRFEREKFKCVSRKDFFNNRIIKNWNSLPNHVVHSKSLICFKANFDKLKH